MYLFAGRSMCTRDCRVQPRFTVQAGARQVFVTVGSGNDTIRHWGVNYNLYGQVRKPFQSYKPSRHDASPTCSSHGVQFRKPRVCVSPPLLLLLQARGFRELANPPDAPLILEGFTNVTADNRESSRVFDSRWKDMKQVPMQQYVPWQRCVDNLPRVVPVTSQASLPTSQLPSTRAAPFHRASLSRCNRGR